MKVKTKQLVAGRSIGAIKFSIACHEQALAEALQCGRKFDIESHGARIRKDRRDLRVLRASRAGRV